MFVVARVWGKEGKEGHVTHTTFNHLSYHEVFPEPSGVIMLLLWRVELDLEREYFYFQEVQPNSFMI